MTDLIARAVATFPPPHPAWPECSRCGAMYLYIPPTGSSNAVAWVIPYWIHPANGCALEGNGYWQHGESNV